MNYPVRTTPEQTLYDTMKTLLRGKRFDECRLLAEDAGQERNSDAIPALMLLLKIPHNRWQCRTTSALCEAREAAVHAVAQIGAPDALSCVGVALFNPCANVRAAASNVLNGAGQQAADPLIRMLSWKQDWSVEGMRVLLYTLGGSGNFSAGPALARVIFGNLPVPPPRWQRGLLSTVLKVTAGEMLALMLLMGWYGVNLSSMSGFLLTMSMVMSVINLFIVSPIRSSKTRTEQRSLAVAACDALRTLGDKKAIPALMTASRRWEPDIAISARSSFLSLLPLLRVEDNEWLQLPVRHRLEELLGSSDPRVILPVLRAMEFVGTGNAASAVTRLQSKGLTPEIRAEAVRIAPILQERWHQERVSSTLLRASHAPVQPQQELLRPASASQATPANELLRPRQ